MDKTIFFRNAKAALSKHSPEILTGIGIAGMITTTVLAVRATPKALRLIDDKKKEENVEKLKPIDVVKVAWKPYIPAAITCAASTACIIGACSVSARRNAALLTAYKLSETALTEYKEQVVETVGEKKEKQIRENVDKKRIERNPVGNTEVIMTGDGTSLCFEPTSSRYFNTDIEKIRRAVNNLNEQMINDMFGYISLNDFYDEIGLPTTDIGDLLGWNINKGQIKIDFTSLINEKGQPCLAINYINEPKYGYDK